MAHRSSAGDLRQYAQLLDDDPAEREAFVHRFAINVSEFFRDPEQFDYLERTILPALLSHGRRAHVWSAGCSAGHEAYSLAVLLAERGDGLAHRILATDIDNVALSRARSGGPYSEKDVRNVSSARRQRHLHRDEQGRWWVNDHARRMITYNRHDLFKDPAPIGIDLIACRNVLIYFTVDARYEICRALAEALRPGGVLFLGATESLADREIPGLTPLHYGFYRRNESGAHR